MGRFFETNTLFHFPWDQVVQAFWLKYPNPYATHILSEDTVHREIKDNKLYTKRLLVKMGREVPKWAERFVNLRHVNIIEESIIDPQEKTLTTYTRNLGYSRVLSITEKVVYQVSSENPHWTVAFRQGWVESQIFGVGHALQMFGLDRFRKNCYNAVIGFNFVLNSLFPKLHEEVESLTDMTMQVPTRKERLKDAARETAKKATDLAKSKAGPIYVHCVKSSSQEEM